MITARRRSVRTALGFQPADRVSCIQPTPRAVPRPAARLKFHYVSEQYPRS